jgi:hypothetical protein
MATLPKVKLKVIPTFPTDVTVGGFLTLVKQNGSFALGINYNLVAGGSISDPSAADVVIIDQTDGSYKLVSLSQALASTTQIEQHVTAPGPVAVLPNAGVVRVDQTVGAGITLNMPVATSKTCPVLIADWKGDAGTNNITIVPNGTEKIQGQSSWTIAADGGSIFLRPIANVGYAI